MNWEGFIITKGEKIEVEDVFERIEYVVIKIFTILKIIHDLWRCSLCFHCLVDGTLKDRKLFEYR